MALICLASPCLAGSERATLAGVQGVKVVVDIDCDSARGLPESSVRRDVEQMLRAQHVAVLTEAPWAETVARAVLRVDIECEDGPAKTTVYSATLELEQAVRLARDSAMLVSAPTWWSPTKAGALGGDVARGLREIVRDLVELFLADYAKANPRR